MKYFLYFYICSIYTSLSSQSVCRPVSIQDVFNPAQQTFCRGYNPADPPTAFKDSSGNLGNKMFTYILLYLIREIFGMEMYIGSSVRKHLSLIFKNVGEFAVGEETLCGFKDFYKEYSIDLQKRRKEVSQQTNEKLKAENRFLEKVDNFSDRYSISDEDEAPIRADLNAMAEHPWQIFSGPVEDLKYKKEGAYILYPAGFSFYQWNERFNHDNPMDNQPGLINFTINSFIFKDLFVNSAQEILCEIGQNYIAEKKKKRKKRKSLKLIDLVYVGIHNRRTDHIQYQKEVGFVPVEVSYFLESMDYFREKYKNVVFVFVSDDMDWGRRKLKNRIKTGDFYLAGSLQDEHIRRSPVLSAGLDLALLSMCNHTILTYGTFGFWAGFLSGHGKGKRIIPQYFRRYRHQHSDSPLLYQVPLEADLPRFYFGLDRL